MILDSSGGNLIRISEPQPSHTQNLCREDTEEQVILDSSGFRLLFASEPFPGYQVKLEKVREEYEGVWYRWADNGEGWLCPALFLYFPEAPTCLYAKAEAL
jgi:hypothetical protein